MYCELGVFPLLLEQYQTVMSYLACKVSVTDIKKLFVFKVYQELYLLSLETPVEKKGGGEGP